MAADCVRVTATVLVHTDLGRVVHQVATRVPPTRGALWRAGRAKRAGQLERSAATRNSCRTEWTEQQNPVRERGVRRHVGERGYRLQFYSE